MAKRKSRFEFRLLKTKFLKFFAAGATALGCFLAAPAARAGDEPEHRYLTYVIAIAAGYSPDKAKIISDGAWSLDTNNTTTALESAYPTFLEHLSHAVIDLGI